MTISVFRGFLTPRTAADVHSLLYALLCAGLMTCFPPAAVAAPLEVASARTLHEHADIIRQVRQFLLEQQYDYENATTVDINVGFIDSRLKLSHCESPLELSTSTLNTSRLSSGKVSVKVRCAGSNAWTIYVPSSVVISGFVLVASKPLSRGHLLTKNDVTGRTQKLNNHSYGYYSQAKNIIGMEVKSPMRQGQVFTPHKLKAPLIVQRGDRVSLVSTNTQFSVKMSGTALSSGSNGDRIRVKNLSSKRIVEGQISAPGVVTIRN